MTCTVDRCERAIRARRLCHKHYMEARRHGVLPSYPRTRPARNSCTECSKPAKSKGLCSTHYEKQRWANRPVRKRELRAAAYAASRPPTLTREERLFGTEPKGTMRPFNGGRISPSNLPEPPASIPLTEGFIPGSKRVLSAEGKMGKDKMLVHTNPDCRRNDPVFSRMIDVWEHSDHPEAGQYMIDKVTLMRIGVKVCSYCTRATSQVCKRGHEQTPENVYIDGQGRSRCRPCARERRTERKALARVANGKETI